MNKLDLVIKLAKAYNNLNFMEIEGVLSNEIVYENQNVLTAIVGVEDLRNYLCNKFELIKSSNNIVFAEIGFLGNAGNENLYNLSDYKGKPCIILSQGERDNKGALILIEVEDCKISRIDLCTIAPHWSEAKSTNQYP